MSTSGSQPPPTASVKLELSSSASSSEASCRELVKDYPPGAGTRIGGGDSLVSAGSSPGSAPDVSSYSAVDPPASGGRTPDNVNYDFFSSSTSYSSNTSRANGSRGEVFKVKDSGSNEKASEFVSTLAEMSSALGADDVEMSSTSGVIGCGVSGDEKPWICGTCTLENKPLHLQCDACGATRATSGAETQAQQPPVHSIADGSTVSLPSNVARMRGSDVDQEECMIHVSHMPSSEAREQQGGPLPRRTASNIPQQQQREREPPQHHSQRQNRPVGNTSGRVALPEGFAKRRLEKERRDLLSGKVAGSVLLKEDQGDEWLVEIKGAEGTLYSGETFTLRFKFVERYPIERPEVVFVGLPPVHPHIYSNGHICLSILSDGWSPALSVQAVCLSLISMLSSCKKKERPSDDAAYCSTARFRSPKHNLWWFHDDTV